MLFYDTLHGSCSGSGPSIRIQWGRLSPGNPVGLIKLKIWKSYDFVVMFTFPWRLLVNQAEPHGSGNLNGLDRLRLEENKNPARAGFRL